MPQVKLKIEVNGGTTASGFNVSADKSANNVGFSSMPQSFDDSFKGTKLLVIDSLYINDKGFLANGVNEDAGQLQSEQNKRQFVYGKTDANAEYELTLTMTTDTGTFDRIVIVGDSVGNQFPIEAIVDGTTTIYSDDPIWALDLGDKQSSHTIKFTKWNKANYNACFNQVKIMLQYLEIDRFNGLQTVESLSQSTPNANSIYYGTLANSGSAEIVDIDGEIEDMINDGLLDNSNVPVELYIDNHLVQSHITTDSDYNTDKILSLQFTNKLEYWDKITYGGYAYPDTSKTAYEMLYDVLDSLGYEQSVDDMLSEQIIYGNPVASGTIKSYLQAITIPYPYLPSDTYRNTIDKFCRLAQLQVFQKDNGDIKFISARPIMTQSQASNAITIPKYAQIKNLNKTIVLKNKYDAVEIQNTQVDDSVKYDEGVSSTIVNKNDIAYDFTTHSFFGGALSTPSNYGIVNKLEAYYTSGTFNIAKKTNYNLLQILSVNITGDADADGYYTLSKRDNKFTFSVDYDRVYGSFKNNSQVISDIGNIYDNNSTFASTEYYSKVNFNSNATDTFNGQIPVSYVSANEYYSNTISITDSNYIKIKDVGDYLSVKYYILSRVVFYDLDVGFSYPSTATSFKNTPRIYKNEAVRINISMYGNKREISFENISASDDTSSAKTIATVQGSELLQVDTKYNYTAIISTAMSTLIKNNIKNDYVNGISSGNIELFCTDLYDTNNNKVIDFNDGETLQTNDVLSIVGDNNLWRAIGRQFKYDGQSTMSLQVEKTKYMKILNFKPIVFNLNSSGNSTTYFFEPQDGETYDAVNDQLFFINVSIGTEQQTPTPTYPFLLAFGINVLGTPVDLLEYDHSGLIVNWRTVGSVTLYKDKIQVNYNEATFRGATMNLVGTIYYVKVIG